ncbi:hypothetical protein ASE37_24310 [Rhizobium sp. Root268]|nr:hypothetical protein ASC86_24545 [Rhizobium sp. Root1212]KRD28522.1 hypothetical protein ASE37_24310 [Rhizobium sp. Root268]
MQAVPDKLGALEAKPFFTTTLPEPRTQASPSEAARAVRCDTRISFNPEAQVTTKDIAIPSISGTLAARIYIAGGKGPFPLVVCYHAGGWVVADIAVYGGAPRAPSLGVNAIVVSIEYRHAPEHRFPAAHDEAWGAYAEVVENIHELDGNSDKIAVVSESAAGNLAAGVALMAKGMKTKQPVHQRLAYPVAGNDMNTPSY